MFVWSVGFIIFFSFIDQLLWGENIQLQRGEAQQKRLAFVFFWGGGEGGLQLTAESVMCWWGFRLIAFLFGYMTMYHMYLIYTSYICNLKCTTIYAHKTIFVHVDRQEGVFEVLWTDRFYQHCRECIGFCEGSLPNMILIQIHHQWSTTKLNS